MAANPMFSAWLSRGGRWTTAALVLLGGVVLPGHAMPTIQHWQTPTGVRVYFVENHDLPMVDLSVEFPAGSAYDTPAQSGLASLTRHLMKLGAGGLSEDEIARRIADAGAQLSGRFDQDRGGWSLRTLSSEKELNQATDVLARILQQPEFPETALDRERARLLDALREADTKPDNLASRAFFAAVYAGHPYALRTSGEVDTLPLISRQDLVDFYRRHYNPERAVVSIVGDFSRQQAEEIAARLTDALPKNDSPAASLPPVPELKQALSKLIPHPATQSHILLGAPGMRRGDPDFFALFVGNHILGGGGFASRLTEEVREKRGLAYSAYSYFSPQLLEGPFQIGLQTQKEQTEQALEVVRATLRNFVAQGPMPSELDKAKQNIVGSFPLRIDNSRKIQEYVAMIGFYRLPLTYLEDFVTQVQKVTAQDIRSAFARRVHPDKLVTVVVGAPSGIK